MPRQMPIQHRMNQQVQQAMTAQQPSLPAHAPNPDKYELTLFDTRTTTLEGPLDAREALRRFIANSPMWVRSAMALRLTLGAKLKWHGKLDKEALAGFELRPGGRIGEFELSTVCGPAKVIGFVQDRHIYVQLEISCRTLEDTTEVVVVTYVHPRTRFGKRYLNFIRPIHNKVMVATLPGVKVTDPNFPAVYPDFQRKGFRQVSRKKLKQQGMLPEQLMEKMENLKGEMQTPTKVEIPKKKGLLGKLFGGR